MLVIISCLVLGKNRPLIRADEVSSPTSFGDIATASHRNLELGHTAGFTVRTLWKMREHVVTSSWCGIVDSLFPSKAFLFFSLRREGFSLPHRFQQRVCRFCKDGFHPRPFLLGRIVEPVLRRASFPLRTARAMFTLFPPHLSRAHDFALQRSARWELCPRMESPLLRYLQQSFFPLVRSVCSPGGHVGVSQLIA